MEITITFKIKIDKSTIKKIKQIANAIMRIVKYLI